MRVSLHGFGLNAEGQISVVTGVPKGLMLNFVKVKVKVLIIFVSYLIPLHICLKLE